MFDSHVWTLGDPEKLFCYWQFHLIRFPAASTTFPPLFCPRLGSTFPFQNSVPTTTSSSTFSHLCNVVLSTFGVNSQNLVNFYSQCCKLNSCCFRSQPKSTLWSRIQQEHPGQARERGSVGEVQRDRHRDDHHQNWKVSFGGDDCGGRNGVVLCNVVHLTLVSCWLRLTAMSPGVLQSTLLL